MKRGWDAVQENGNGSGATYVKIESGKSVLLHILDDAPVSFHQHWVDGRGSRCKGANCPACATGIKRMTRLAVNVWNQEAKQVQVFENGRKVFGQIKAIRDAYDGSLKNVDIKIQKTGSGLETTYVCIPLATKGAPADVKLFDLEDIYKVEKTEETDVDEDGVPF